MEDQHCPDGYKCDECGWCVEVEDNGCDSDSTNCDGYDAECNIPAHDNCFYCDGTDCQIGKSIEKKPKYINSFFFF